MVAALPGNIQLKLQQTLAQWRQWDCQPALQAAPQVVQVLAPGLSNYTVLVESGQRFVLRIDGVNTILHGLNRQGEWRSLEAAYRAGLAPRPRYFNPELGSLVCDYLPPDEQQPLRIADIATLLRGIHTLPARHHRLDLPERILGYEKSLAHRDPPRAALLAPYRSRAMQALAGADAGQHSAVLCHHDLLQANRLYSGGRLYAIDWEYSAMGNCWYDLAVVAAGDSLTAADTDTLLQAYLGRPARTDELLRLKQYACAYRYLELLWYLVQQHPGLDEPGMQHKLELLEQQLEELSP
jgi:thiamine kinase-like enzyme